MRTLLALPALLAALSLGCSSGNAKPADGPTNATDSAAGVPSEPGDQGFSSVKNEDEPKQVVLSSGAKNTTNGDGTIPDDYALTEADCDALGKQYAEVAKSDQMAGVSPKLSPKQKDQAEANIDKVVSKLAETWIDACQKSLAGKIVDRKSLKCAMDAKTVAAFKACIGDDGSAGAAGANGGGAKAGTKSPKK